jgi:hypothetical protein
MTLLLDGDFKIEDEQAIKSLPHEQQVLSDINNRYATPKKKQNVMLCMYTKY